MNNQIKQEGAAVSTQKKCFWCRERFDEDDLFILNGDTKQRQFCHECLDSISNDPIDVAQQRRKAEECHLESERERELEAEHGRN